MTEPKRNSDINSLSPAFRKKFDAFWWEVKKKYPDAMVFEAKRSQERQNWLYGVGRTHSLDRKPVTRTLNSNHKDGNAVDIIFNGKREWPYDDLIEIGKNYGIRNLKPKETCHFEDDGIPYNPISAKEMEQVKKTLQENSNLWENTTNQIVKDLLKETNGKLREIYNIKK